MEEEVEWDEGAIVVNVVREETKKKWAHFIFEHIRDFTWTRDSFSLPMFNAGGEVNNYAEINGPMERQESCGICRRMRRGQSERFPLSTQGTSLAAFKVTVWTFRVSQWSDRMAQHKASSGLRTVKIKHILHTPYPSVCNPCLCAVFLKQLLKEYI
jgi:hypothetical protein